MGLLDVISHFATPGSAPNGQYTVTRLAGGAYDPATGEFVNGAPASFTITAAVHPYSAGRHQVTLPEGARAEDVRVLWTATQLRVTDDAADNDVVMIPDGLAGADEPFYVFQVNGPWTMHATTFYRAYVARRKQP